MSLKIVPYSEKKESKTQQVSEMFDNIAHSYDFLNRLLSLNIDRSWRKKSFRLLKKNFPNKNYEEVLDLASGTGDFAFQVIKELSPKSVVGLDISQNMLAIAEKKAKKLSLEKIFRTQLGDSENIPFPKNSFDLVTVAFGVRNFENLEKGIEESLRVLKSEGCLLILEFSTPKYKFVRSLYNFYLHKYIPLIGKYISKDIAAYSYLGRSVKEFIYGKPLCDMLEKKGFRKASFVPLSFGICSIYIAQK